MKPLSILVALIITGCATTQPMEKSINVVGLDFQPFTDRGFFMTPERYTDNYESRGVISVTLWPQVMKRGSAAGSPGVQYAPHGTSMDWMVEVLSTEEALEEAYKTAVEMNADALVNMDISTEFRTNGMIQIPGIKVTGYAIKRTR